MERKIAFTAVHNPSETIAKTYAVRCNGRRIGSIFRARSGQFPYEVDVRGEQMTRIRTLAKAKEAARLYATSLSDGRMGLL